MNRSLIHLSTVLATLFLIGGSGRNAVAQSTIQLNGHPVQLTSVNATGKKTVSSAAPDFQGRIFRILQKPEPINGQFLETLRQNGLSVSQPLGQGLYLVSMPTSFQVPNLSSLGFRQFSELDPSMKIHPNLAQQISEKAGNAITGVQVLACHGLKAETIQANWNTSWGTIREVWSGQVSKFIIDCNAAQLQQLALAGWTFQMEAEDSPIIPFNQKTASSGKINTLQQAGFGWATALTGKNVTVAVGDGGMVESHADLFSHQKNLTSAKISSFADHQDHVTGTIAGAGLLQADKKGMAPEARILNVQTSAAISTGASLRENQNVTLTNNSYGLNLTCTRAGNYNGTSSFIDDQINSYPDLLHLIAAGNQGVFTCNSYPYGFQNMAEGYPVAKNALTVGAVLQNDGFAWFSSKGPAKDGRLKPELVVNGNEVESTVPFDSYGSKGGTSMATPAVTGTMALLTERYKQLFSNQNPESAFLKALVCNTADDLGLPNADFTYGFGRLNGRKARRVLENQQFQTGTIGSNGYQPISLSVPSGCNEVKIMLCWTDPAAPANTSKALINDLNIQVQNQAGFSFMPWVANPSQTGVLQAATRQTDTLNNMEQVTLPVVPGENLILKISTGNLSTLNQKYWIVYDWVRPELVLTSPVQREILKSGSAYGFYWDVNGQNLSSLVLESSPDSVEWNTELTISNLDLRTVDFMQPGTGFLSMFYRLKGTSEYGTVLSNAARVFWSAKPVVTATVCEKTVRLEWNALSGATKYDIRQLNREAGRWETIGQTDGTQFIVNQLENGTRYGFSVLPRFGNKSGLASDGMFATPASGSCPWTSDLGISALISPLSGRLNTSTAPSGTVRLEVRNFASTNASNVASTLFFRKPDGTVSSQALSLWVNAGESQVITLPQTLNLLSAGQYPVEFWLVSAGDVNAGNDSLSTILSVLPNPVLTLPWLNSFENMPDFSTTSDALGIPGNSSFDFISSNGARISSVLKQTEEIMGTRSLVLDKERIDGTTGNADLILTLNLSAYPHPDQLILDFDWLPFGNMSPGNGLWMRSGDEKEWVEVRRFSNLTYSIGTVSSLRGINLLSFLDSEALTSSFQLKFTGAATRAQDLNPAGGYAIDNLVLSMPGNDVEVLALTGPVENCYTDTEVRKVKIRVFNTGTQTVEMVQVGYKLVGQNAVTAQIGSIATGDTVEYEFNESLPSDLYGLLKFKLWAFGNEDSYPTNDTLRNASVFLYPVVSGKSYYESFEANAGFWKGYGQNSSWEWGVPSKNLSVVDTAANGIKIWKTNLKGNYNNKEQSYLQSPCLNLEDYSGDVQFSFNTVFNLENDYDHMWLEMSEDGINWLKSGSQNSGTNWYNHGLPSWNGLRSHWEVASQRIPYESIGNKPRVRFRFAFSSDASLSKEGFGIDDIHLEPAFKILKDSSFYQDGAMEEEETWVSFGKLPDKVASIENSAELGNISMEMKINKGAVRMFNGKPYLDRNYLIVPENQPSVPVKVRLFVTDAEVKKLQAMDAGLESFQQLGIFKYDGANQDLDIENNENNEVSSSVFIPAGQVLKVPTADGYFLEFQVDGFSEFYVTTQSLAGPDSPLPVEFISFTAKNQTAKGDVLLEWKTASEINLNRFELAASCDGKNFEVVRTVASQGSVSQGYTYRFVHTPSLCNSENVVYRLQSFDNGQLSPSKELRAVVRNDRAGENPVRITNPVINQQLEIANLSGDPTQIHILDATGRICYQTETSLTGFTQNISSIPSGVYSLQIVSADTQKTFRILIR